MRKKGLRIAAPGAIVLPACVSIWSSAKGDDPILGWLMAIFVGAALVIAALLFEAARICWKGRWGSVWPYRSAFGLSILAIATVGFFNWPLQLAFSIWRAPLTAMMDRVERGERVETPVRVGTFLIVRVEKRFDGSPSLILDDNSTGPTSLIRHGPSGETGWSYVDLPDGWMLFTEE